MEYYLNDPNSDGINHLKGEMSQMEVVCLNSESIFGEGNEDDCTTIDGDDETIDRHSRNGPHPPTIGLEYNSFDEAYDFYNIYAKEQGFGIRVSNSWFRSKRKERYRAKLSCSNAGFKKKSEANNPRPETRTGCPAMIVIKLIESNRWRIIEVDLEHNHPVSPEIKRFYKSHKRMILAAKQATQSEPVKEIHTIKLFRSPTFDVHCDRNDIDHFCSKYLELREGDATAVYNYFCRMKLTDPNFFYLMDFCDEGRLRNVFWADARSRDTYSYFYDAMVIDTTCLTNKYEIPLISFVGMNHHGQSVLFGCGFIGDESVDYFVWMFETWLTCMLGRSPQVIITDQSRPLDLAVCKVFPQARHCYCVSYIMRRVPEKLGGLKGYETIKQQLFKAVYESLKIAEFETWWFDLIKQHGLEDNKWLQSLHDDREKWVPVYLKDTFFAGMIPIKENEGLNSFFDGYVHKHTSFKEFVDKYDLALQRKHLKEAVDDLDSRNNSRVELKTECNFEFQLSKIYTRSIFSNFQSEVEGMFSCFNTRQVNVNGPIITYVVKERVNGKGNEKEVRCYEVLYETNRVEIRCICSLFNFRGYLCRHALNVLNYNGIEEIPLHYILQRWSKDYKRKFFLENQVGNSNVDDSLQRYNHLYKQGLQVVEEGSQSEEHYKVVLQQLEEVLNKCSLIENNPV